MLFFHCRMSGGCESSRCYPRCIHTQSGHMYVQGNFVLANCMVWRTTCLMISAVVFSSCQDTKYLCYDIISKDSWIQLTCHLSPPLMLTCFPAKWGTVTSMPRATTSLKSYPTQLKVAASMWKCYNVIDLLLDTHI